MLEGTLKTSGKLIALLALATFPAFPNDHRTETSRRADNSVQVVRPHRVRLAGVSIGAGYGRSRGYFPGFYGYGPYAYDPFYPGFDPFYAPGFYNGFARGRNTGEIKLHSAPRDAEVFIDGAYAGEADHLKTMSLEPGAYNLEVRVPDRPAFTRRVYVLTGKTLRVNVELGPAGPGSKP